MVACAPEIEQGVTLGGQVSLEGGAEPSQIRVRIRPDGGGQVGFVETDKAGRFEFEAAQVDYKLTFSKEGYLSQTEILAEFTGNGFKLNEGNAVELLLANKGSISVSVNFEPNWIPEERLVPISGSRNQTLESLASPIGGMGL